MRKISLGLGLILLILSLVSCSSNSNLEQWKVEDHANFLERECRDARNAQARIYIGTRYNDCPNGLLDCKGSGEWYEDSYFMAGIECKQACVSEYNPESNTYGPKAHCEIELCRDISTTSCNNKADLKY